MIIDIKIELIIVRRNGISIVTLASISQPVNTVGTTKKYSRKENKIVDITKPSLVRYYNKNMSGVGRMDQNISCYRIAVQCKSGGCLFNVHARCSNLKCLAFLLIILQPQQRDYRLVTITKSNEKQCLQNFVFMVSGIIHLAIQLNAVVRIVVKRQNMFAQNRILDFAFIVLKVIMKM